jgi:DNA modification methylase
MEVNKIYQGNTLEVVKTFPDNCIDCCITSPPYWSLRDYEIEGQLGLEKTPEEYVSKMVDVFREVKRVLKKEATLWLNLGDSYTAGGNGGGLKPKDLCGIPWRVAFALQSGGWYLRSDIIWSKPNPMPESVTDRPTRAHEYIFLLTKSKKYFYNAEAIKEPSIYFDDYRKNRVKENHKSAPTAERNGIRPVYKDARSYDGKHSDKQRGHGRRHAGFNDRWDFMNKKEQCFAMRNKRDVWIVATKPFKEAHFATFPTKLIEPCVLAGCPEGGIILDPFMGSGTTGNVARKFDRNYVGIELNPQYIKIAEKRISKEDNLFNGGHS